jgi:hypothetical protein
MSRWWKYSDATILMRRACEHADGDVAAALAFLKTKSSYPGAELAVRIIERRAAGAVRFRVTRKGYVVEGGAR